MQIDINADLGEGFGPWRMGDDAGLMEIVTTANVACGFHAGDPETMRHTIRTALDAGVAVGAHPGFQDLIGFGRRPLAGLTAREVENLVAYQVGAFGAVCAIAGHRMTHVKTHGALGNMCADDDPLADAVARAIRAVDPSLAFMVMPGVATERAAERVGLRLMREVYADRTYDDSFNLTSRRMEGAVIHDPAVAIERAMRMVGEGEIVSRNGKRLKVEIDTICVHGDNVAAVSTARRLRTALEAAGWSVASACSMHPAISRPDCAPPRSQ